MAIALALPIVPPALTGYDVALVTVDLASVPHVVTISYVPTGSGQSGAVSMTLGQFDAAGGAGLRLRALNALAGPNGLNLAGATVT